MCLPAGGMPVYPVRKIVGMASRAALRTTVGHQPAPIVALRPAVLDDEPTFRYLTIPQVCAMTGYSRTTIERALRDGHIGRYGLPRAPRLLEHEVIGWMADPPAPKRRPSRTTERAGLPGSQLRW